MKNYCDNTKKHFDIKNIDGDLCDAWLCLEVTVVKLPDSIVKEYFIFKMLECAELKLSNVADLYHMNNSVSRMIGVAIQENLNGEMLGSLEAIREAIKKIISYVESERVF